MCTACYGIAHVPRPSGSAMLVIPLEFQRQMDGRGLTFDTGWRLMEFAALLKLARVQPLWLVERIRSWHSV